MLLIGVAALGGCANTGAMRTLAGQTSSRVTVQSTTLADFVKAQQQLNAGDANELQTLEADAARQNRETALVVDGWKLAGRADLVGAEAGATRAPPAEILASLNNAQVAAAALSDGGAAAKLVEAGVQFSAMAKKPKGADAVKEMFSSANAVYAALETQKAAASSAAAKAQPAPTPATKAATPAPAK